MVIRCKFPVISYLFSVVGGRGTDTLSVEPKKKKIVIDKEKTRSILHVPIDLLERSMQRGVFGNKITIVRSYSLDFNVFLLLLGPKQLRVAFAAGELLVGQSTLVILKWFSQCPFLIRTLFGFCAKTGQDSQCIW